MDDFAADSSYGAHYETHSSYGYHATQEYDPYDGQIRKTEGYVEQYEYHEQTNGYNAGEYQVSGTQQDVYDGSNGHQQQEYDPFEGRRASITQETSDNTYVVSDHVEGAQQNYYYQQYPEEHHQQGNYDQFQVSEDTSMTSWKEQVPVLSQDKDNHPIVNATAIDTIGNRDINERINDDNKVETKHVVKVAASLPDINESRLRRPALTFGFGGRLIIGVQADLVLVPGLTNVVPDALPQALANCSPCLQGGSDSTSEQVISIAGERLRRLNPPIAQEDGRLPGSTTLLNEAIALFLETQGRRSDGLRASGPAEGTFERALLDLLSSNPFQESSAAGGGLNGVYVSTRKPDQSLVDNQQQALLELEMLLMNGDQKAAVNHAVRNGLWTHALIISNYLSAAEYRRVVSEFTKQTLSPGIPMHSVYQVLAGRGVDAVSDDPNIGQNWKQTLRVILANRSPQDSSVLRALGDRLWMEYGSVSAAHLCYIAAGNACLDAQERVMLVGGDHMSEDSVRHTFATPGSILRTEAFLYAQSLHPVSNATQQFMDAVREFQPFRLVLAMWLADYGESELAKQWVTSIRQSLAMQSSEGDDVFLEQLVAFESRLYGNLEAFQPITSPLPKPLSARLMMIDDADGADVLSPTVKRPLTPPPMFDVSMLSPRPNDTPQKPEGEGAKSKEEEDDDTPAEYANPFAAAAKSKASARKAEAPTPMRPAAVPLSLSSLSPAGPEAKPNAEKPITNGPTNAPTAAAPGGAAGRNGPPLPPAGPSPPTTSANKQAPPPQSAPSAAAAPQQPPPQQANQPQAASGGSSLFGDVRGWLTQKILGVPKNATVAKMGDKLSGYYDTEKKRWIWPGEPVDAGPAVGPPPTTTVVANQTTDQNAPATTQPQRPGAPPNIVRNRYVIAS